MATNSRHSSEPSVPLVYSISQCSAHSGRYGPENIIVDNPADQASRWSGAFQANAKQWILLRLESLGVVKSITFGKFHKAHPCNMKEFKLYVGATEDHLTEVLHSGLRNDSIPETFTVQYTNKAGVAFPTRFVKIVPLSAYGQSFHTSIWFVSMTGITDKAHVDKVSKEYEEYRETAVLRHVLKHLRQRRLLSPYHSILARSGLQIEHPLVTELHESIVLQGNWTEAEQLLDRLSQSSLFDTYLRSCQPHATWKRLAGTDADGDVPSPRGGHAMCIDPVNRMIYLFGGWDGKKSLDDFWSYDIKEDRWHVLSHGTSALPNAPGARSCHKMVFDTKTGSIYVLGRLSDADVLQPPSGPPPSSRQSSDRTVAGVSKGALSEFYRYHTRGADRGKWDFLSFDTATSGGPPLIFDHQMVMDCAAGIIYVFGGRVVDGDWDSIKYSGLYSYNVRLSKWRLLQHAENTTNSNVMIPSRFGHSMVFEPSLKALFIFAGQRDEKYLSDMYVYDIQSNTATELYSNFTNSGGPDACFTQRAVIDHQSHELYVFCGLTRNQQPGSTTILPTDSPNWVYHYYPRPGKWTRILPEAEDGSRTRNAQHETGVGSKLPIEEPSPRYAHQVVYDPTTKSVFMHGGNAGIVGPMEMGKTGDRDEGDAQGKEMRLDDFWSMSLTRPGSKEIIRRATYRIRQQQFREMCEDTHAVKALGFLQNEVSSVVDHHDPKETEIFRSLLTHLLAPGPLSPSSPEETQPIGDDSPPRKRSRPNTPEEKWTNVLHTEEIPPALSVSADTLRSLADPMEHRMDDDMTPSKPLTQERFKQRNEVFESLLEFISDDAKQPSESLLDLVDHEMESP